MRNEELKKEIYAVLAMTERRLDAVCGQIRDCELLGQKKRARAFRAWRDYLYRTGAILREIRKGLKNGGDIEKKL